MKLTALVEARQRVAQPPAWTILLVKAFATLAARRPEFRRAYLPWPWPHLWQADESIASIAVEREYRGEMAVFFGFIKSPEVYSIQELMAILERWKTQPVETIHPFRRQLKYAGYPTVVRRFLWTYATSWSGQIKARNFGTFGISLTGAAGATARNLIGPLSFAINTGIFDDDGSVDVRIHFDHRVVDGMPVARALAELEQILCSDIVKELELLSNPTVRTTPSEESSPQ
ncbi:MAG: hypothetical protein RMJ56_02395 [Gemmataceae bacterium]|nr:hypothetical protein [Gemmata sp.]MDW8196436.1 hypothetical protein [Gemmataceae bacterium]